MTETLDYADHDKGDLKRKSSRPSREEGHRLVQLVLSVERTDLREEILNFVEAILRRQDRDQSIQPPRAASSRKSLIERHRRGGLVVSRLRARFRSRRHRLTSRRRAGTSGACGSRWRGSANGPSRRGSSGGFHGRRCCHARLRTRVEPA